MKIWIVAVATCDEDKIGIAAFDHPPTEQELYEAELAVGGTHMAIMDLDVNGSILVANR